MRLSTSLFPTAYCR